MVDDVDTEARTLDRAGDTELVATESETAETMALHADGVQLRPSGYLIKEVIGRGGMGEVLAAQDRRIGREVAFKRLHGKAHSSEALARFLREARIQGRLDHPAIVPVYELGTDAAGDPYFTMKRVSGVTLAERIADGARIQPLLRALVDVCLAVELAHQRGIVHRDLKPSNIMLGELGEVYVLDWGVARVIGRAKTDPGGDEAGEVETQQGSLLGTLGYMAPEQVRDPSVVGPAADVYSLGAILFEILAGEPLHPRGEAAIASTLVAVPNPAARRPEREIAPELDAACGNALALDPAARPSARELAARIQNYLDGDRDLARRRSLAAEYLANAHAALATRDPNRRADAVHLAGRALALDPESAEAAETVTALLVEPPPELPPELEQHLEHSESHRIRHRARRAAIGNGMLLLLFLVVPLLEVKSWPVLLAIFFAIILNLAIALWMYQRGRVPVGMVLVGVLSMIFVFARVASPLVLVPTLICSSVLSVAGASWLVTRRWGVVALVVVAGLGPFALEWTGVLDPTWFARDGTTVILSDVFDPRGVFHEVALVAANVGMLVVFGLFAHSTSRDRRSGRRELQILTWHLDKLLPNRARVHAASL